MKKKQIIVIGAGISGLVAAYRLQKEGFKVTVLEASTDVGGRMMIKETEGFIIDGGAQFLSSGYPILSELIEELGLSAQFVETSPYVGIVRDKKVRRFRYDNPFSLLKVLRPQAWFSMGMGGYKLQPLIKNLPVNNYAAWAAFDDEDTRAWGERFYTPEVTDYFLEPMLEAFYFQTPEQTSRALPIALTKFTLEKSKTMTLKGGINLLAQALAEKLDIRLNTAVTEITPKKDQVEITTPHERFLTDKAILTTPAPIAKTLYTPTDPYEQALLETPYSTTINLSIGLKERLTQKEIEKVYGIWIPKKERDSIAAITIERFKCSDRATEGELLNVMLCSEAGREMIGMPDEVIVARVLKELDYYIPDVKRKVRFTHCFRWEHAEPLSQVGRAKQLKAYRENLPTNTSVYLAGDYMSMPFTEGAAESAVWVASKITDAMKHSH